MLLPIPINRTQRVCNVPEETADKITVTTVSEHGDTAIGTFLETVGIQKECHFTHD
jgi:hypothetical protein